MYIYSLKIVFLTCYLTLKVQFIFFKSHSKPCWVPLSLKKMIAKLMYILEHLLLIVHAKKLKVKTESVFNADLALYSCCT